MPAPKVSNPPTLEEIYRALRDVGKLYGAIDVITIAIGTSSTRIRHGLKGVPSIWFEVMPPAGGAPVKQSSPADADFLYLQSATAGTYNILVIP